LTLFDFPDERWDGVSDRMFSDKKQQGCLKRQPCCFNFV